MQFLEFFLGVLAGIGAGYVGYKAGQYDAEQRLNCIASSLQNVETELAMKRDRLAEIENRLYQREEEIRRQDKTSWDE